MKKYESYKEDFKLQKRRKLAFRIVRGVVSVLITGGVIVVLLFFLNFFEVRTIVVNSSASIPAADVEATVWRYLEQRRLGIPRKNNSLLVSPDKIRPVLMEEFARIESVEVDRTSLHEFSILVKERSPVGLWCFSEREHCYYYDVKGIAFAQVASSSGFLFVAVNDGRSRQIDLGDEVAPEDWRQRILEIKKILQFGGISVQSFQIPPDSRDEFAVVTGEGWSILYVNDDNVRKQTNSLLAFLKEKLEPAERAKLEYVDLRIDDRIYYKSRE